MPLNDKQQIIVDNIEGIMVVDAGAGTGKTTTIASRYEKILEKVPPDKILMLTFTDNAAENMRDKIINECVGRYTAKDLVDAPIRTFHSFCNALLRQHGFDVPGVLGISEGLHNYGVMEREIYERYVFKRFFSDSSFLFKRNLEQRKLRYKNSDIYSDIHKVIDSNGVFSIIKKLCCKGIFPQKDGWFNNGEELLQGDFQSYRKRFNEYNQPVQGKKGLNQSELLKSFKQKFKDHLYIDTPSEEEMFMSKQVNPDMLETAFFDDRTSLINFIHDVYFEYIEYCLKINRINYDFMIMFAFILLYNDHELRNRIAFDYVIVDEFQDTDEIQFMMILLLMKTNNLCVVGDWKQGIYGFRNATIDNILEFDEKIRLYKDMLNNDYQRVGFNIEPIHHEFDVNYRSSQRILDFSEKSLLINATNNEDVDQSIKNSIIHLNAEHDLNDRTEISFLKAKGEDECELIISKIQEIVSNSGYLIKEKDENTTREVKYKDIAVLSRRRSFGLELQERAREYGIPANYDGGIELFRKQPSILVLAWLRLALNENDSRGWVPILEKEGYRFFEMQEIINSKKYPESLLKFRNELVKESRNVIYLADRILKFYGFSDNYSNALINELGNLFKSSVFSVSDLVNFIRENIVNNEAYEIDINSSEDAVTIQTIHGAKGLEYPVVFIVDVNERHFPSANSDSDILLYHDLIGLRIRKEYGEKNGYKFIFDKWQTDLLTTDLFSNYDEERRLLYVAITRAKQYVIFTAEDKPSPFFYGMAEDFEIDENYPINVETAIIGGEEAGEDDDELYIEGYEKAKPVIMINELMECGYSSKEKAFSKELHYLAKKVSMGINPESEYYELSFKPEAENIKRLIKSYEAAELRTEIECSLPLGNCVIQGVIDLLAIYDDSVEAIDYKIDLNDLNEEKYQKQLSVYYHVLKDTYLDKQVYCSIYYACMDRKKRIEPVGIDEINKAMSVLA